MKIATTLAAVALLALTGCASIVSTNKYPVTVTSSPEGVPITVEKDNGTAVYSGTTPFTVTLNASDGYFDGATYYAVGPRGGRVEIDSSIDGWYWGNILLLAPVTGGLIVDPLTGSMWKLPEHVHLNSQPVDISGIDPAELKR